MLSHNIIFVATPRGDEVTVHTCSYTRYECARAILVHSAPNNLRIPLLINGNYTGVVSDAGVNAWRGSKLKDEENEPL